ncbi:putative glycosyl hydrolase [Aspergillus saccharolyticus JOP 1030-1]|uniref:Six-hairpin glycosidase n=1 Tax=Aspergillus saccharolyticus JOP 1030-1 TaxID=1450539 RepID=A0A318ZB63_9EURO|nr:Six-hairpin glycosidase [Aspergillus saccharolyticus JOP 1030-1]PYH44685.1 Six-hairpin glycosidase [Aspergillus saccharolyticus JOP 1030-1]
MHSLTPIITLTLTLLSGASATNTTAMDHAYAAATTLQTYYNPTTGIWNTCGWWNGANCLTTMADLSLKNETINETAVGVFENTFRVATNTNPYPARGIDADYTAANGTAYTIPGQPTGAANASLWLDGSYDDDMWWGLAWVAAYDVTGVSDYLDLAEGVFYHLSRAWPSLCGNGGIDSDYTHVYVGAIPNELFLALGAQLANRAADSEYYLDWAKRQWAWFEASGLINDDHTINDGLTTACTNNGMTVWSYNQGVILGALVELHRAAGSPANSTYLEAAGKIAQGAIAALTDAEGVVHESCEPDACDSNETQFKGIFVRNLKWLQGVAPNETYARVINASAASLWANDRTDANGFGVDWSGPVTAAGVNASTQSSALDALVAAIW